MRTVPERAGRALVGEEALKILAGWRQIMRKPVLTDVTNTPLAKPRPVIAVANAGLLQLTTDLTPVQRNTVRQFRPWDMRSSRRAHRRYNDHIMVWRNVALPAKYNQVPLCVSDARHRCLVTPPPVWCYWGYNVSGGQRRPAQPKARSGGGGSARRIDHGNPSRPGLALSDGPNAWAAGPDGTFIDRCWPWTRWNKRHGFQETELSF